MKRLIAILFLMPLLCLGQDERPGNIKDPVTVVDKTLACGTPFLSSGYPNWTNYWGGYQFNIVNVGASDVIIHSFEARFQGNAGYRIYTKVGTFVGFETNAGAWTLVGSIGGGLTGLGTTIPTPIPITVDLCIPVGGVQAFYLTRTNNTAANRHLYIPGTGTPGTTQYASDANIALTEAHYVTPYFAALYAQSRRPSLDVCYSVGCILPIELASFTGHNEGNVNYINWETLTETNNSHFILERSRGGENWDTLEVVPGAGNSSIELNYMYLDNSYIDGTNYYRLTQVDFNGASETFHIITVITGRQETEQPVPFDTVGKRIDHVTSYKGMVIWKYKNGSYYKTIQ